MNRLLSILLTMNMTPAEPVAHRTWSTLGLAQQLRTGIGDETLTGLLVLDMLPNRHARDFGLHLTGRQRKSPHALLDRCTVLTREGRRLVRVDVADWRDQGRGGTSLPAGASRSTRRGIDLKASLATKRGVGRDLLHGFDCSERLDGIPSERVSLVPGTEDHVGLQENGREPGVRAYPDLPRQGIATWRKP